MARAKKLNPKQQRFCEEYIIDLNATQAALRAGYCANTVNKSGPANLVKVGIRDEICRLKAKRSERTEIKVDDVVWELAKIGFSNLADYMTVDEDGEMHLKDFEQIDRSKLAAVESIKVNMTRNKDGEREYITTQFKLHSKINALEQLGKHLGIYERDNEQRVPKEIINLLVLIDGSSKGKLPTSQEIEEVK